MDASAILMIYGGIFIGVLLLVEGVYHVLVDLRFAPQRAVNRRLRMLASGVDREEVLRLLRRQNRHEQSGLAQFAPVHALNVMLMQAGAALSASRLLLLVGFGTGVLYVALRLVSVPIVTALLIAVVIGVVMPVGYVALLRRRRLAHFGRQLPDALDLIVRSLRAGHPLSAALTVVAEEMPDPIGSEFGITVDETTYGLALPDAVENMAFRCGHPDLHYFVVAIRIQYGTGGNLAEILSCLGKVIRDRFNMQNKIRAVSAEGRLSAIILSAMPLVVAGAISLLHPAYYTAVASDPWFPGFVYVTMALIVTNVVVLNRLVNFKF